VSKKHCSAAAVDFGRDQRQQKRRIIFEKESQNFFHLGSSWGAGERPARANIFLLLSLKKSVPPSAARQGNSIATARRGRRQTSW
jgi:hypothetical protein